MNRRDFLTLVASASIAALAPLPGFLPTPPQILPINTRAVDGAAVIAQRVWRQACACRGNGMRYGPFIVGAGVSVRVGTHRPPFCTACGTDWIAEYI